MQPDMPDEPGQHRLTNVLLLRMNSLMLHFEKNMKLRQAILCLNRPACHMHGGLNGAKSMRGEVQFRS